MKPLCAAHRLLVPLGSRPSDQVGKRFGAHLVPVLACVNDRSFVGHDPDMTGKKDKVAAFQFVDIDILVGSERGKLQVGVARQLDAGRGPGQLDQS